MEKFKPKEASLSPLTPLNFLERAAIAYSDCTSIIYNDVKYTWSETHRRCLQVASSLRHAGIEKYDVVSVVAANIPAMAELHFAVPMSGAVLNNINTRLDARTVALIFRHSDCKLVFVDHLCAPLVLEAFTLLTKEPPMFVLIEEDGESEKADVPYNCFSTYNEMVKNGDPNFEWIRPDSEWDPIALNYTSGTTSAPKGVVMCHRAVYMITVESLIDWAVPKNPVYLWTLPMFHANGWSYTWGMAAVGGTHVCLRKVDVVTIFSMIKTLGVTHMCGAPVVLNMLSNSPDAEPLEKSVQIMTAGAPPPASVLERTESLGFVVSHGYGMTEVGGIVVTCAWKKQWNKLSARDRAKLKSRQGIKTAGFAVADIVDPDTGEKVPRDGTTMGEIVYRGASVMLGYLKDEKATSACLKDGWLYTGDVGVMHPDGYMEIKDRSKDVIISGGENISSTEVESVLYGHPAVNEAAVVARPHEFWGETPCAFVSVKAGAEVPTEKEMIAFCREKMPHYMVPKTVVFEDELPKTSTGKIQKYVLRDRAKALGSGISR